MNAFKRPPSEGKLTRIVFRNLLPEYRRFLALHEVRNLAEMESVCHELEQLKDLDARYLPPPPKDKCRVPGSAYLGSAKPVRAKNVAIVELVESGGEAAAAEVGESTTVTEMKPRRGGTQSGMTMTVTSSRDNATTMRRPTQNQETYTSSGQGRDGRNRYGISTRNDQRQEPGYASAATRSVILQENVPRKGAARVEDWDTGRSNVPRDPPKETEPPNAALGVTGRGATSNRAQTASQ